MFAVIVRESGDAQMISGSSEMVRTQVAPAVRMAPGFVSAAWMTDRAGQTLNVIIFESEELAKGAMERARLAPRPPFMAVDDVELFEVLAMA